MKMPKNSKSDNETAKRALTMTNKCKTMILSYMRKHKITLPVLAKRMGVTYQCAYSKFMGDGMWNFGTLMTIADALDLEVSLKLSEVFNPNRDYSIDKEK